MSGKNKLEEDQVSSCSLLWAWPPLWKPRLDEVRVATVAGRLTHQVLCSSPTPTTLLDLSPAPAKPRRWSVLLSQVRRPGLSSGHIPEGTVSRVRTHTVSDTLLLK